MSKMLATVLLDHVLIDTDGTAVQTIVHKASSSRAYLHIVTEEEAASASLATVIRVAPEATPSVPGFNLNAAIPAIVANGDVTVLIGDPDAVVAEGVDVVAPLPMARDMEFVFTVSGVAASFLVTVILLELPN